MLKTHFEIGTITAEKPLVLLVEIGENFITLSFVDPAGKTLEAIKVYTFDRLNRDEGLQQIIENHCSDKSFEKVVICSAFPEAILIPRKLYQPNDALLKAVYALSTETCLHDVIGEWQIINSYAVPVSIVQIVDKYFSDVSYIHSYTPSLKIFNGITADNQIATCFISNQFSVVVKKNQQLQLVQTYSFNSPMDVVYYLLKICTEFQLSQEETHIIISGFIAEDSALYKELYNYFLNLHFATVPTSMALPDHDFPKHFFTSVNNLAACVL